MRYPLLELTTAVLMAAPFIVYESIWVAVGVSALLGLMPVITVIDLERRIIPNKLMYPALVVAAGVPRDRARSAARLSISSARRSGSPRSAASCSWWPLVSRGMGMGDVKLAALIGLVLGALSLGQVAVAAGAAIVLGALGAVVALAARGRAQGSHPVRSIPGGRRRRRSPVGAVDRRLVPANHPSRLI